MAAPYYRAPNKKRLVESLKITAEQADKVRKLLHGEMKPTEVEATAKWVDSCFNVPRYLDQLMHAIDATIETYGVETLMVKGKYKGRYEYCNTGDPYTATVIYNPQTDSFYIGDWGTLAEGEL